MINLHKLYFFFNSQLVMISLKIIFVSFQGIKIGLRTVAVELPEVHIQPIRDWDETILFYIALTPLTVVSLIKLLHNVYTSYSGVNSFIHRYNWSIPSVFYRVG